MGLNFQKHNKTEQGYCIYLVAFMQHTRIKYNTKVKVKTEDWNDNRQEVRKTYKDYGKTNDYLRKIKDKAAEFMRDCEFGERNFNTNEFKRFMDEELNRKSRTETMDDIYKLFIEYEKNALTDKGEKVKAATVRKYELNREKFLEYEQQQQKRFYPQQIDKIFFEDFQKFLTYTKNHKVGQVHKDIGLLKTVLFWAQERGFKVKDDFRKFRAPTEKVENVALYLEEIRQLYNLDLSDNPELDKYKVAFLIGCYCGARPSDFMKFTKEKNITTDKDGNKCITYHAQKTGKKATIQICNELDKLLEKSNYEFPKIDERYINRKIKEICKLAGLNRQVETISTKGGKREIKRGKLYDFIVGKTAKRTFVTSLYYGYNGESLSLLEIAGYTGNNLDTIRRYLVINPALSGGKINRIFAAEN